MKTMRAAVLTEQDKPLRIMDVPVKEPGYGQVLVRLAVAGICQTQLLEIAGKHPGGKYFPNMLGHEGAGIVEKVGPGVTKVKAGDHVILSWIKGSGTNVLPGLYDIAGLTINAGWVTTWNEYTLASENRVTRIVPEMPLKEAAIIGCAVATGVGAVLNNAKVRPGESVIIIGCGGIGINMVNAAAIVGAHPIICVDIIDDKLAFSRKFGATHTINAAKVDVKKAALDILGPDGADYAFEAAGKKETMELAYAIVKKHGGKAVLCGVPDVGMKIAIEPGPLYHGRQIAGSSGGESDPDRDYPRYVRLFLQGKLKLTEMITHTYTLDQINEGIETLRAGKGGRIVIDFRS
jgi:S-(hydroxymethyl)glutathione dehydrogenase / alcohol dehydrogenase